MERVKGDEIMKRIEKEEIATTGDHGYSRKEERLMTIGSGRSEGKYTNTISIRASTIEATERKKTMTEMRQIKVQNESEAIRHVLPRSVLFVMMMENENENHARVIWFID